MKSSAISLHFKKGKLLMLASINFNIYIYFFFSASSLLLRRSFSLQLLYLSVLGHCSAKTQACIGLLAKMIKLSHSVRKMALSNKEEISCQLDTYMYSVQYSSASDYYISQFHELQNLKSAVNVFIEDVISVLCDFVLKPQ